MVKQGPKSSGGHSNREPFEKLMLDGALNMHSVIGKGNVLKMIFSVGVSM